MNNKERVDYDGVEIFIDKDLSTMTPDYEWSYLNDDNHWFSGVELTYENALLAAKKSIDANHS